MNTPARRISAWSRWRLLRAQLSMPTLLSKFDEKKVVAVVAAVDGGAALLIISVAAWLSGLPLLFPSLAPSAFILFTRPFSAPAAPRSIILGHSMAIACGWLSWASMSLLFGSPVSLESPSIALWLSADIAFGATCILMIVRSCPHPPACGTALIVALGAIVNWSELLVMMAAIMFLAFVGVTIHRLLGVHTPLWRVDPRHDAIAAGTG